MRNMNRHLKTVATIGICAALATTAYANDRERGEEVAGLAGLTGTWRVHVTTYNCATGVANLPFESILSFDALGTLTGTTANPLFLPGQRSPDFGIWKREGWNYFSAATEAYIEFSTPASAPPPHLVRGVQRIEQGIELTGSNSFSSDAKLTFTDEGGTVVLTGCAKAVAQRFK